MSDDVPVQELYDEDDDFFDQLSRATKQRVNPEWGNKNNAEFEPDIELEMINLIPDEKLPLYINRVWKFERSVERYKERLKNAKISS